MKASFVNSNDYGTLVNLHKLRNAILFLSSTVWNIRDYYFTRQMFFHGVEHPGLLLYKTNVFPRCGTSGTVQSLNNSLFSLQTIIILLK